MLPVLIGSRGGAVSTRALALIILITERLQVALSCVFLAEGSFIPISMEAF